ncbi:MAG: alpha/beta fold hydrolase [Planctomycetes bacterium]|nr:alpha/beta fold hydrolase [Planctomycetota bacterium]
MIFPLGAALVFLLPTALLAGVIGLVLLALGRSQRRYWRLVGWLHLTLLPLHLFVTFPAALGLLGSRGLGTRPQERTYSGPRVLADGRWQIQTWDSLAEEARTGRANVDDTVLAAAKARRRELPGSAGVTLRAFVLAAKVARPRALAVLTHGLFRSAMELEPPAAMFWRAGCEVWLVEQRNHGGSSRSPFSAGFRESDDLVAAVAAIRADPERSELPLVLFGVSLGTIAVNLALPRIPDVRGVVLDAPIEDLTAAAHRMLSFQRENDNRSRFSMAEPWRSLVCGWLQYWSDFTMADVSPMRAVTGLRQDLAALVVAAGEDDRAPPATVEALFRALPMAADRKEYWLAPASRHGQVWIDDPEGYESRVRTLLERALTQR